MMNVINWCMTLGLCLGLLNLRAQEQYWVYFTDKDPEARPHISPKTIDQRHKMGLVAVQYSDLPVKQAYLAELACMGISDVVVSRWLNAVSVPLYEDQKQILLGLPFVKSIQLVRTELVPMSSNEPLSSGLALKQIGANNLSERGLNGEGVAIGIIDNGFVKADLDPYLQSIFDEGRLIEVNDFFSESDSRFFSRVLSPHDDHGKEVWKLIGGLNSETSHQLGLAPKASYYLARTDHGSYEFRQEEANWVAALEWLDSLGVRLVHSSLGYSKDYDSATEDYRPEEMDGKTAITSVAAKIAIQEKGMIIVTSAGNEGADPDWRVISSPADVEEVIAVGATDLGGKKQSISGIGISKSTIPKPDISCFSNGGTSFAAPVVTGLVACLLQQDPLMKNDQVRKQLIKAGDLYPFGNNYVGYGVPDANRLFDSNPATLANDTLFVTQSEYLLDGQKALVFHKSGAYSVLKQQLLRSKDGKLNIQQQEGSDRATIRLDERVLELFWQ